jgi:hypothetical protein
MVDSWKSNIKYKNSISRRIQKMWKIKRLIQPGFSILGHLIFMGKNAKRLKDIMLGQWERILEDIQNMESV